MEIHYIWINKFNDFNEKEINLSARFIIQTRFSGEDAFVVTVRYNSAFIRNFFDKPNITNVTALIGKNGSGKTSILNYIKSHLPEGLEANISNDLFVYSYFENGSEKIKILYPRKYELTLEDETGLLEKEYYEEFPGENNIRFNNKLSDAEYIYYSFFLDYKSEITDWSGLRNISTTALLQQEWTNIMQEHQEEEARNVVLRDASTYDYFVNAEMQKAMQFLISDKTGLLPFRRPQALIVTIDKIDGLYFTGRSSNFPEIKTILEKLDRLNESEPQSSKPFNNLLIALFTNFLLTEYKYNSSFVPKHIFKLGEGENIRSYITGFFQDLSSQKYSLEGKEISVSRYIEFSRLVPEFIAFTYESFVKQVFRIGASQDSFAVTITQEASDVFSRFMFYYLKVKGLTTFLNFKWAGLSTGEQSYLSFVSRFFHLRHHEIGDLKHDLVILIDEGDAGFHPEWQRKFFKSTIDFLSSLFMDHDLQFIFAANAPFITSDLPKSHIIFLEKKFMGDSLFYGRENDRAETFGANIHTLFSNSFFMEGALMGEFSKTRIDTIIKYLNDQNITIPDEGYRKTIEIIGEPILRRKLLEMWADKFGTDLTQELESLRRRMKEIEELQAKKDD